MSDPTSTKKSLRQRLRAQMSENYGRRMARGVAIIAVGLVTIATTGSGGDIIGYALVLVGMFAVPYPM